MARNVEIKARAPDPSGLIARINRIATSPPERLRQRDTFFAVPDARLKLRECADAPAQLIYYRRPDTPGPKQSDYIVTPVAEPDTLVTLLAQFAQPLGTVTKYRRVWMCGQTRIHFDEVDGLGSFLELEVVLDDGQSAQDGHAIARDLMQQLAIREADLVSGAYYDLLFPEHS